VVVHAIIPAIRKLGQEEFEFVSSLSYIVIPYIKKKKKKNP
jgi:hypothetical protein